jgi:hypothetical protein
MWVTLFALAIATSVCFSAANLAVQLRKDQADVNSAIESRSQTRTGQQFSSVDVPLTGPAAAQFD